LTKPAQIRATLRARHISTIDLDDDMSSEGSVDPAVDDISVVSAEGNVWPFHSDIEINNSLVTCINLVSRTVATEDTRIYSFNEAIEHLNSLIR
jgi:hypothetical protein